MLVKFARIRGLCTNFRGDRDFISSLPLTPLVSRQVRRSEKAKLRAGRSKFAEIVVHLASDESKPLSSLPMCAENGVHIAGL